MWSKPLLCRFRQSGKIPQVQVSQGFAAFHIASSRIPPRHSQTRRDTNFAIPGDVSLSYHVLQEKATGRAQKICARPDLFAVPQFGFELPKVPKLCIFKRLRGNRNTKGNWEFAVWTGGSRRVVQGKGDVRPEQVRVDGQGEGAALQLYKAAGDG